MRPLKVCALAILSPLAGLYAEPETKIVFSSHDSSASDTHIMNADGGNRIVMYFLDSEVERLHPGYHHSWTEHTRYRHGAYDSEPEEFKLLSQRYHRPFLYSNGDDSRSYIFSKHPPMPRMPVWSPNQDRLAFSSDAAGTYDVYVIDRDGSNEVNLTEGQGDQHNPVWSPDGSTIIFDSDGTGDWEIFSVSSLGGEPSNLSANPKLDDMGGVWSPDGKSIVYEPRVEGLSSLWVMDAAGTQRVQLADRTPGHFHWSPDSAHLAYDAHVDSVCDVFIARANGTHAVNVSQNQGNTCASGHFAWSPDGSRLAFVSNRRGQRDVYTCDVRGEDLTQLTDDAAEKDVRGWFPIIPEPLSND